MDNENIISVSKNILPEPQTNDFCNKNPDKVNPTDLNNFWTKAIPEGFLRKDYNIKGADGISLMKKTGQENYQASRDELLSNGFSEKRLDQVNEDFFAGIDQCMKETKIDVDGISRLYSEYLNSADREKALLPLHEKLIPLYYALRKQGYSHYDLVV